MTSFSVVSLIVKPHHPVRLHRQIGDDEADTWEEFAWRPFDLGDDAARLVPGCGLILEVLVEALDLDQRRPPHGPGQPVRDLLAQDAVGGQPDGVEIARLFQSLIECGDRIGGIGPEEPHDVPRGIPGDHRIEHISPAVGTVDVAVAQGAAFQHAELVEQEVRVITGAFEMPVPGGPFLIAMGRADRAVHVQHDILQAVAIMEPVDPLPVQVGQRFPVLGQGQRLGLEPPHLGSRGRLRIDRPATHDLAHHGIEGQPVSVVDILVSGQPPIDRLPKQPIEPMDGVPAPAVVAQRRRRQIGQPERVIQLAHHQKATVRTELRATKFQAHARVEIHPICPLRARTLWVIHETRPS